jgi:hypothetical protein
VGQTGREANAPLDEVRKCFEKAHLAALAAPYRHPRLSAFKQENRGFVRRDLLKAALAPSAGALRYGHAGGTSCVTKSQQSSSSLNAA